MERLGYWRIKVSPGAPQPPEPRIIRPSDFEWIYLERRTRNLHSGNSIQRRLSWSSGRENQGIPRVENRPACRNYQECTIIRLPTCFCKIAPYGPERKSEPDPPGLFLHFWWISLWALHPSLPETTRMEPDESPSHANQQNNGIMALWSDSPSGSGHGTHCECAFSKG